MSRKGYFRSVEVLITQGPSRVYPGAGLSLPLLGASFPPYITPTLQVHGEHWGPIMSLCRSPPKIKPCEYFMTLEWQLLRTCWTTGAHLRVKKESVGVGKRVSHKEGKGKKLILRSPRLATLRGCLLASATNWRVKDCSDLMLTLPSQVHAQECAWRTDTQAQTPFPYIVPCLHCSDAFPNY